MANNIAKNVINNKNISNKRGRPGYFIFNKAGAYLKEYDLAGGFYGNERKHDPGNC